MRKILVVGEHVGRDCCEAEHHDFDVRELHEEPCAKTAGCAAAADFFKGLERLNYKADCQIRNVDCSDERKNFDEIFKGTADKINDKDRYY